MEVPPIKIHKWLYPVSWLYGAGVYLRNKLFDWKILQSKSFDIPVICIGNIAVGGTGKTPHTEYLIRLLQNDYSVAVLSRGYKRKTKGFVLADEESSVQSIGDEPFQIKSKYPQITVAVDAKRTHGIEKLLAQDNPAVDLVLLDDAFQHRYINAGLNILLTDYNRIFCDDALMPAGRLRESEQGKDRAHIVIVTKCPDDIKPIDFNIITKQLNLRPCQELYFSRIKYTNLIPVYKGESLKKESLSLLSKKKKILLVTGIASPAPLIKEINKYNKDVYPLSFPDHHNFSGKDIQKIAETFYELTKDGSDALIITTEKDATRFIPNPTVSSDVKEHLYSLPIEIEILQDKQQMFNQSIINYVRKN